MRWINPPKKHFNLLGEVAGSICKNGYCNITIEGKKYTRHRLAFLYMVGKIPEIIDHIDRNPKNDSWENLRSATNSQNQQNRVKWSKNGLPLGVKVNKSGTFSARITVNGNIVSLGSFKCSSDAGNAYVNARSKYFGEFA